MKILARLDLARAGESAEAAPGKLASRISAVVDQLEARRGTASIARRIGTLALVGAALAGCGPQNAPPQAMVAGLEASQVQVRALNTPPAAQAAHADARALNERFEVLGPIDASEMIDAAYQRSNNMRTRGVINGKAFTAEELVSLRDVAQALRPLWRCNYGKIRLARVDYLAAGTAVSENTAGATWGGGSKIIAFADASRREGGDFQTVGTAVHEFAHEFVQFHDPFTCAEYNDTREAPLMKEYIARMRDKENKATNWYGNGSWDDDMAESLRFYMTKREWLRSNYSERAAFWDDVFARLKVAPPSELADYKISSDGGAATRIATPSEPLGATPPPLAAAPPASAATPVASPPSPAASAASEPSPAQPASSAPTAPGAPTAPITPLQPAAPAQPTAASGNWKSQPWWTVRVGQGNQAVTFTVTRGLGVKVSD